MRSTILPKFIGATLVALLLFGPATVPAGAAKKKTVASNITLELDAGLMWRLNPWTFHGRVGSKVVRCERRRSVKLTYRPEGGGAEPYGQDTTNGKGRYEIVSDIVPPGTYVAKVLRAKRGGVTCKAARSKPVRVAEA